MKNSFSQLKDTAKTGLPNSNSNRNCSSEVRAKGQKRLTDEDLVIGGVGEDDRLAEQSGGAVCGGGRWNHAGDTLACGLPCDGSSMSGGGLTDLLGFGLGAILGGCSQDKEMKKLELLHHRGCSGK